MKKRLDRVTLSDIARETGYSRAAVSLALRDHPSIPQSTCERIKAAAKRLNYRPNPLIAKLLAETVRTRYNNRGSVIAYLDTQPLWKGWQDHRPPGFGAASQRAAEYGFNLEYMPLHDASIPPKKLNRMLWTRGVAGLVIPALDWSPGTGERTLPIDWEKFSCVEIDDTMIVPALNRVMHNHLSGIWKALDAMEALGYRRIGLCMTSHVDLATHHRWYAGYLAWRVMRGFDGELQPFIEEKLDAAPLCRWLRQERIEAVLAPGTDVFEILLECGIDIPGKLGFASLDIWGPDASRVSGIDQRRDVLNCMAVDLLVTLVNRNSKGIPEHPTSWSYPGQWQSGETTRRVWNAPHPQPLEEQLLGR